MKHMLTRLKVGSVRTCLSGQAAIEELQSSYRVSSTTSTSTTTAQMLSNTGITTSSSAGSSSSGESQGGRVNLVFTDVQMPVSTMTYV
jgi:predicted short-subunit dehydrogenase-like oxidoreductase (DUF2520 family)